MTDPRLLFCSYHGLLDPASGAALATADLLRLLAARGWACGAVCGPHRDRPGDGSAADHLRRQGYAVETRGGAHAGLAFAVHHLTDAGVPVTVFDPEAPYAPEPSPAEEDAFLALASRVWERFRPDILVTFGGHRLAQRVMVAARGRSLKVVFALHNFEYHGADLFRLADAVFVPSAFARDVYRRDLGIDSTALPGPFDWGKVVCDRIDRRYVTLVNPRPEKGVFWATRLIDVLGRRRPDIPFLVVEGRAGVDWLGRCGVDLTGVRTVSRMKNTPDPRAFYAVSKLVLVPSLWRESFGRVAAEAVMNEIPVIASTRGALPEVLADAGVLLGIPAKYTPQSRVPPSAGEVAPWVAAIERLWDDPAAYRVEQDRCRFAARRWHAGELVPRFEAFFRGVSARTVSGPFRE